MVDESLKTILLATMCVVATRVRLQIALDGQGEDPDSRLVAALAALQEGALDIPDAVLHLEAYCAEPADTDSESDAKLQLLLSRLRSVQHIDPALIQFTYNTV